MTDEDTLERRQRAIRELCQGEGLSVDHVSALPEGDRVAFGASDPVAVRDRIIFAASTLSWSDHAYAIKNALGLWSDGTPRNVEQNLTERRAEYLESREITYRTLVRHEDEGAEILARQIDVIRGVLPSPDVRDKLAITTMSADDAGVHERLGELEAVVAMLMGAHLADRRQENSAPYTDDLKRIIRLVMERGTLSGRFGWDLDVVLQDPQPGPQGFSMDEIFKSFGKGDPKNK